MGIYFCRTNIFIDMKKIATLFFAFIILGCGSIQNTQDSTPHKANDHVTKPNVSSNKYSQKRQG